MKTKQKNLFLIILSAIFAISLFCGIGVKFAFAETATLSSVELKMESGASIRMNDPTGLRFRSIMSASDYNALTSNVGEGKDYSSVSFGMLIAPQDYLGSYGALTEANVFGETAVYSVTETDTSKPQIINVYAGTMQDFGADKAFAGIITNVKPENYNREFVGVGYIKATAQDGTVSYKFAQAGDNSRSVISVAKKAIEAGETDEVLADFTKYASLGGIVSSVENGDKTPLNAVNFKTGEISVTATANDLYFNLNKDVIAKNGAGYEYLRLYLKSKSAAEFWLIPRASDGTENWTYFYRELWPDGIKISDDVYESYVDVPLNDTSVHDFSKYDLRFRASTQGHNITIEKIEYVSLSKELLKADSWDDYAGGTKTENADGSITLRGWEIGISAEYIQKAIEAGYTHLRFDYTTINHNSDGTKQGVYMEGQGTAYQKCYQGAGSARFDLNELKKSDGSYAKIYMQGRDSENWSVAKDVSLTVTNPTLFKSMETAGWTKSSAKVYCAVEENGYIVIDTVYCGNDAHVLSSTEWWAKYANNTPTYTEDDNQRTVILSGKYLYVGSNSRGAVWGRKGSIESIVGATANTEIVTEYANNTAYAEGDKFYYGLDKEGVYALKVNEFVSNKKSGVGFAYTYVDENTFTITLPADGRVVNVNTQDYIAQGYTKVVITASAYTGGQIWVGNDKWGDGGYMHGLDSGKSKELDLTMFTGDNPYLHIFCSGAQTTVTITYSFF